MRHDTPTLAPDLPAPPPRPPVVRELFSRGYCAVQRRRGFIQRSMWEASPLAPWGDSRYEARRSRHAGRLPRLSREQSGVLAELGRTGVAIQTLDLPPAVLGSALSFIAGLRSQRT